MDSKQRLRFVVGIGCALAACRARAASAETLSDPCALLTSAQISAVVGATVGAGEPIGTTGCQWYTGPATPTNPHIVATLALWGGSAFAGMKTPLPNITKTSFGGLGDDAVWTVVGPLTTLSVKKGTVAFIVRLYGVEGQDKQMAMEKALALDVLAKL